MFKTPQNDAQMATAIVEHMTNNNVKTVAYIGFSDAYGEGWWNEFSKIAEARKLQIVANERFNRTDTSVTGQMLKILAAKPDAVLIGGAGTPAALPQRSLKEKGYKGVIYQTHGVANGDFLRVCGKDCEGTLLPAGPVLVAAQLPADNPVKKSATEYVVKYEAAKARAASMPSAPMPGMPACCLRMPSRWRSRRRSPAPGNSASPCATPWRAPRTWPAPTASST